ncbi:MAG: class II fructose-bisphosphate aldolase [Deltaproteobacteria bacterium]|nr:class II fructose-bisphosphate aldolase [Deltaproteobacteria bacterium]
MKDFEQALDVGRPPNIKKLFPNSKALLVSGKVIDRALLKKGKAMTIAANARNRFVLRGVLKAAQRARAAIIIEIAKSEGGADAYCAVNMWNLAYYADAIANELGVTVPIAIHADHYGIKKQEDIDPARTEIPSIFDAGVTSIAIDASHLQDDENLLANLELNQYIPGWAGLETEVGEIKGAEGLSTPKEALFLIKGLNAHGIFPDWIALNNGTTHGIQDSKAGIHVELTKEIHEALKPYGMSGAQHGTSGNDSARLKRIAAETATTKVNFATALQMISWGIKVNDYGNAITDEKGEFIKEPGKGVSREMWQAMKAYADARGLKGGNYKKMNLPFENKFLGQPAGIRDRMVSGVEDFVYFLLTEVFNAGDTAPLGIEAILEAGSHEMSPKAQRIEDPDQWTRDKIIERAKELSPDKGPAGNYDD